MSEENHTSAATSSSIADTNHEKVGGDGPCVVIVLGMAGSGKTSFVQVFIICYQLFIC